MKVYLLVAPSLGAPTLDIGAGCLVDADPIDHDDVESAVQLAVAATEGTPVSEPLAMRAVAVY
jgi:hypothetical protein